MTSAGYLLALRQSIRNVATVSKFKARHTPAPHATSLCICWCSSSVYKGSRHGKPQPDIPKKKSTIYRYIVM